MDYINPTQKLVILNRKKNTKNSYGPIIFHIFLKGDTRTLTIRT
jgi:hypothetical protein